MSAPAKKRAPPCECCNKPAEKLTVTKPEGYSLCEGCLELERGYFQCFQCDGVGTICSRCRDNGRACECDDSAGAQLNDCHICGGEGYVESGEDEE